MAKGWVAGVCGSGQGCAMLVLGWSVAVWGLEGCLGVACAGCVQGCVRVWQGLAKGWRRRG